MKTLFTALVVACAYSSAVVSQNLPVPLVQPAPAPVPGPAPVPRVPGGPPVRPQPQPRPPQQPIGFPRNQTRPLRPRNGTIRANSTRPRRPRLPLGPPSSSSSGSSAGSFMVGFIDTDTSDLGDLEPENQATDGSETKVATTPKPTKDKENNAIKPMISVGVMVAATIAYLL